MSCVYAHTCVHTYNYMYLLFYFVLCSCIFCPTEQRFIVRLFTNRIFTNRLRSGRYKEAPEMFSHYSLSLSLSFSLFFSFYFPRICITILGNDWVSIWNLITYYFYVYIYTSYFNPSLTVLAFDYLIGCYSILVDYDWFTLIMWLRPFFISSINSV